jgi:hypothetical protein
MGTKITLSAYRTAGRPVQVSIDPDATEGATFGKNVYAPDGTLVPYSSVLNPSTPAGSTTSALAPNLATLAAQGGTGVYVLTGPGTSAVREIVSTDGSVTITNGDGVAGDIDLSASGGKPRGITVTGGSFSGSALIGGDAVGGLSASDYTLTGNWYLWCSPSGSVEVDVRRTTFGTLPPGPGDSMCGGNEPAVVGGLSASGTYAGWTSTTITQNDALSVVVNSATTVTWFALLLEAV